MRMVLRAMIALVVFASQCHVDAFAQAPTTTPQAKVPSTTTPSAPPATEDKPHTVYDTLFDTLSEKPKWDIDSTKCNVQATIDYDKYYEKLPELRKAWLNQDYSLEDNLHHARQLLTLIIMRHMGA
ncbi:exported protein of unknown function [Beijerinckiaceae bacterium RH AL1]|nr:exported protein of unknown function [Beijerinckiaceae bacterium RH CH11]VVB48255.1 exported protein of unknown function [Beijerinckiaceae bacterium RH AL8]VVC56261.1 exported protein of unknown function [Beijerinckiaceae bacterium RH AL1]